jgi:hypothetical protein
MDAPVSMARLIDVALVVLALEAVILGGTYLKRGGPIAPRDIVGQLLAGALLLAAVRSSVAGGPPALTLGLLAMSFPAHLYDLWRRAQSSSAGRAEQGDPPTR